MAKDMHPATPSASKVLPVIVLAQFACTSLWFAGNAVSQNLTSAFQLGPGALGHLTSSVQFGFITGTLLFALLSISDRYSPSRIFLVCALLGAATNLLTLLPSQNLWSLMGVRFATGFFLAGIYPVGMKIASDYHEKGLGKALGFLVGALVVGTALPHLIRSLGQNLAWQSVFLVTSVISASGGLVLFWLVPDGPFRKKGQGIKLSASFTVFAKKEFRSAAFGYFGHMWELYAFWAFVPALIVAYQQKHADGMLNASLLSFVVIASGGLACVIGGYLSLTKGSRWVAAVALTISALCCLLAPVAFLLPTGLFLVFLLCWGLSVVADSPQFSTLVAQSAPRENTGTALTIVNCIGFSITILSIELISSLSLMSPVHFALLALVPGPALGLWSLLRR